MVLKLTAEELELLVETLTAARLELDREINRSFDRRYKEELKRRRDTLDRILAACAASPISA